MERTLKNKSIKVVAMTLLVVFMSSFFLLGDVFSDDDKYDFPDDMPAVEDMEAFKKCLCYHSCNQTARCGVVSCLYAPEPSDESPNCADLSNGVCKCVGFGCSRVPMETDGEIYERCIEKHGLPTPEDLRSDELQELDEEINLARNQLLVLIRAKELGKASSREVSEQLRELTSLIGERITLRMEEREDLSDDQKERLLNITKQHLGSYREVSVGEGSSVVTSCRLFGLWCTDTLHLDPSSSVDVIYHELGHLIYEELSPDFQELTGSSAHDFAGFSSSEHVAFDEAMANFIALDLMGSSTYGSARDDDEIIFDAGYEHYMYDFATNVLYLSDPSDRTKLIEIDEDHRAQHLKYYGHEKLEQKARERIGEVDERLRAIAAETAYLKGRIDSSFSPSPNLRNYIVNEAFVDMERLNEELEVKKHLFEEAKEAPARLEELAKEAESLKREKDVHQRKLNRPAYSPKAELAVTRLLYEITGGNDERDRLGKVLEATENFTNAKGRGPTSEFELLQGFLHGKEKDSEEFQKVINLIQSDDFRRKYDVDSLVLN